MSDDSTMQYTYSLPNRVISAILELPNIRFSPYSARSILLWPFQRISLERPREQFHTREQSLYQDLQSCAMW